MNKILADIDAKIEELTELRNSLVIEEESDLLGEVLYEKFTSDMQLLHTAKAIYSGIQPLDDFFYKFFAGNYILIAARPSVGKTALALSIALNMIEQGKKVLFISLEMTPSEIVMRLASMNTGIPIWEFRRNSDIWLNPKLDAFQKLIARNNFIVLNEITEKTLQQKIEYYKNKYDLDAVFLDYIGLIPSENYSKNENDRLTHISRSIKLTAIECEVPIFVLSQLSRESERRNSDKPTLTDIRSSGAIEQDADIVLFPYRYKEKDSYNNQVLGKITELIVAKNRNGKCGTIGGIEFIPYLAQFKSNELSVPTEEHQKRSKKQQEQMPLDNAKYDDNGDLVF